MSREKILYVITKSVWGGAQKYVYDLATNLPKDQFDVVVVAGGNGPLVEKLEQALIRTITLPVLQEKGGFFEVIFSLINLRALFSLIKILRTERPNIIHLSSSKLGGIGGVAAFVHKLLTLNFKLLACFTVHGWPFNEARPWWQRGIIFSLSWFSVVFQNKVVLIDTPDYSTATKFLPRRKLVLIPNGVVEIDFLPREEARSFLAIKIGRPIASDTILIGTIAELTRNKGLSILLSAMSRLNLNYRGLTSIIIGEGDERKQLTEMIQSSGLSRTVFITGSITDAEKYIKGFDLFVLPSLKEGLPYTIMEAMAAGLPIVATNVGGLPDLITHKKEGLIVPPMDPETLSAALAELIENEGQRKMFGTLAQKKVQKYFRFETMLTKTITFYHRHKPH